ncbi:fatty acid desaturase [Phlyctochytrium arcticum]|nr:fatty acid desaturase [Phlyctochytrium arcticum]
MDNETDNTGMPQQEATSVSLSALRKSLPAHVFDKSVVRSTLHYALDAGVLAACYLFYGEYLSTTSTSLQEGWIKTAAYIVWMNVTGFFMWSLFCIGHDCGHGTYSRFPTLNAVVGHLTHGALLVPFWPWARSHAQHHAYHNHKDKDMSHPWSTEEEETTGAKFIRGQPFLAPLAYGFIYLLAGLPDGSHFVPWSKLFRNNKERIQCVISAGVVLLYLGFFAWLAGSARELGWGYGMPWLVYNTWLYAVTFLQHHSVDTKVYANGSWSFTKGAVETVDRQYFLKGWGDWLMHNITDGHVVHHLFYTSVPHYRLSEATDIVAPALGKSYRRVDGFPLWEFIKSHVHSLRPSLKYSPSLHLWTLVSPSTPSTTLTKEKKTL